jgi:hypothetical protein
MSEFNQYAATKFTFHSFVDNLSWSVDSLWTKDTCTVIHFKRFRNTQHCVLYINKIQQDATVSRCLFTAKLLYIFRVSIAPIIRVHKTVTAASGTGHSIWETTFLQRGQLVTLEEGCCSDTMTCTRGCSYSFMYSWWWVLWTPETRRVILQ